MSNWVVGRLFVGDEIASEYLVIPSVVERDTREHHKSWPNVYEFNPRITISFSIIQRGRISDLRRSISSCGKLRNPTLDSSQTKVKFEAKTPLSSHRTDVPFLILIFISYASNARKQLIATTEILLPLSFFYLYFPRIEPITIQDVRYRRNVQRGNRYAILFAIESKRLLIQNASFTIVQGATLSKDILRSTPPESHRSSCRSSFND